MEAYREHAPSAALARSVACFWTVTAPDPVARRVLPDGCLDVLFDRRTGRAEVVGAMTAAIVHRSDADDLLGVRFRPGEAAAFLGVAAGELTDDTVPLGDLWEPALAAVAEQVAERPIADAIRRIEAALLDRWRPADWRVRRAVAALGIGGFRVDAVAADLGLGERQLERLFTERVGLGPKRFARVARLQRILPLLGQDLATVAAAGGYVDPSHVVREIRALSGLTPRALATERAMSDSSNHPSSVAE